MIYTTFVYFGALAIPILYLAVTLLRGQLNRLMLYGLGIQLIWSLATWGFVYYSYTHGYRDYWMAWGLLLPINLIGFVYYLITPVIYAISVKKKAAEQDAASNTQSS